MLPLVIAFVVVVVLRLVLARVFLLVLVVVSVLVLGVVLALVLALKRGRVLSLSVWEMQGPARVGWGPGWGVRQVQGRSGQVEGTIRW